MWPGYGSLSPTHLLSGHVEHDEAGKVTVYVELVDEILPLDAVQMAVHVHFLQRLLKWIRLVWLHTILSLTSLAPLDWLCYLGLGRTTTRHELLACGQVLSLRGGEVFVRCGWRILADPIKLTLADGLSHCFQTPLVIFTTGRLVDGWCIVYGGWWVRGSGRMFSRRSLDGATL